MRVLVCGSRTFRDVDIVNWVLTGIDYNEHSTSDPVVIIEGGAKGADALAKWWVDGFGTEYPKEHEQYPAQWQLYGNAAGPMRNRQMLEEGEPDIVLAFVDKPLGDSRGTNNMVTQAKAAGVPVYVIEKV